MAKLTKKQKALAGRSTARSSTASTRRSDLVKQNATAKFDETVEVALNLGVDPRHADQMVRGVVTLPKGTGKTVRVAVFAKGAKADEATAAGADVRRRRGPDGRPSRAAQIDFDRVIATPDMMGVVGRLGKVLGPKGLMPNPKLGTVTMDVTKAVKDAKAGQVEFRVEKAGIIHAGIGKASFPEADLQGELRRVHRRDRQGTSRRAPRASTSRRSSLSSTHGPGRQDRPRGGHRSVATDRPRHRAGLNIA